VKVTIDMEGGEALIKQLSSLGGNADDVIEGFITDIVLGTHQKAVAGIQHGPASGRVYKRRSVVHKASAPGEYPMSDTGRLAASVEFDLPTTGNLVGRVGTSVLHGRHMEFGTSRVLPRPWLMPSFEWAKSEARNTLKAQIKRLL
jgi:hypothetical protein